MLGLLLQSKAVASSLEAALGSSCCVSTPLMVAFTRGMAVFHPLEGRQRRELAPKLLRLEGGGKMQ